MTYKPEGYYVIRGRLTWAQLDEVLGESEYGLLRDENARGCQPCGLSPADTMTYRIYCDWVEGIGSRSAHVVLHPNGVCFSGSLKVEQDWALAKELCYRLKERLGRYQKVLVEVHNG